VSDLSNLVEDPKQISDGWVNNKTSYRDFLKDILDFLDRIKKVYSEIGRDSVVSNATTTIINEKNQ
jgi:hypothetical protein